MKYCTHCGKELLDEAVICMGCGCSTETVGKETKSCVSADEVLKKAEEKIEKSKIFSFVSVILGIIAVVLYLFVHTVLGVVILCAAVICTLIINISLNNVFKLEGIKKADKKRFESQLCDKNKSFKFNNIVRIVVAVLLILSGIGLGIIDSYKSSIPSEYSNMYSGDYGYGFVQQIDEIKDIHDFANYIENQRNILGR